MPRQKPHERDGNINKSHVRKSSCNQVTWIKFEIQSCKWMGEFAERRLQLTGERRIVYSFKSESNSRAKIALVEYVVFALVSFRVCIS